MESVYILKRYSDLFWIEKNGIFHTYYIKTKEDLIKAIKAELDESQEVLKEDSVDWNKEKQEVSFNYYDNWDTEQEYFEYQSWSIIELKYIGDLI
jgi:hypothetical protein